MIINGITLVGFMAACLITLVLVSSTSPTWSERKRDRVLARRNAMQRHPSGWAWARQTPPPRPAWAELRREADAYSARVEAMRAALYDQPIRVDSRRVG